MPRITIDYIRENVEVDANGCWLWQKSRTDRGYGKQWGEVRGERPRWHATHRVAFRLAKGAIPQGAVIRHTCDVPACCNPEHLLPGSQADNMRDMFERGRNRTGAHDHAGERNPSAKLTDAQVIDLRERYAAGNVTQAALAREFGISPSHLSRILSGRYRKAA